MKPVTYSPTPAVLSCPPLLPGLPRVLPVPSGQSLETLRSERVLSVRWIIPLSTVRPAPFFVFSLSLTAPSARGSRHV